MKKFVLFCLLAFLLQVNAVAQPKGGRPGGNGGHVSFSHDYNPTKGFVFGQVVLTPEEPGKPEEPGQGVVVQVITSLKDKRYTTTDGNGRFRISGVKPGKAVVSFSLLGYETQEKVVDIVPGQNRMIANLKPSHEELQAAVVKETVSPVSVVADTIIFNAAAVKVNPGEMAIDILEQMPGVEVTDNGITVLNEQVQNVYIDGALLFGNAPMKALNNLAAEDVVNIKSYQEYANKDPYHKFSKNEEKQRVLDVTTRSHPKYVKAVDALAGGGFDTDSTYHKFRYAAGVDASFFSESLQLLSKVNINNINNDSNRRRGNSFRVANAGGSVDLRNITAELGAKKKWMSPTVRNFVLGSISGTYAFSDKYDVSESVTQQIYFPTEKYSSRQTDKGSYKDDLTKVHSFTVSGDKALRDGKIQLDASFSLNQSLTNSRSSDFTSVNAMAPKGSESIKKNNTDGDSYSVNFEFKKGFKDKYRVRLMASFSGSDGNNATDRVDSTSSTITKTVLDIDGTSRSRDWSVTPVFRYEIDDCRTLIARYNVDKSFSSTDRMAFDITDPGEVKVDSVNTRHYTKASLSNTVSLAFENYFERSGATLRLQAGYKMSELSKDETFPEPDPYEHRFNAFVANARIGTESQINNWKITYNTSCSLPSLEEIRPLINNSNLYSLSAGNPLLEQSRKHAFTASYSTVLGITDEQREEIESLGKRKRAQNRLSKALEKLTTFSISADFTTVRNPIVGRQTYFAEDSYLEQYDYTMPAQSTLNTYENAPASYSASLSARIGTPLNRIHCLMNSSASVNWDRTPSYIGTDLTTTTNFHPNITVGIRTNFSKNIRINLNVAGNYIYSDNTLKDCTHYFMERVNLGFELNNILKHLYAGGNYRKVFTQNLDYGQMSDNILNARAGVRWGPKNQYDFSVSASDLFNNKTGFSTSMKSDYVSNVWKHQFGRYVMFCFTYRFNQGGRGRGGNGPTR